VRYLEDTVRYIVKVVQLAFYILLLTCVGPAAPGSRRNAGVF
jgi:hypothetical protein